jgi:hypothetical protein
LAVAVALAATVAVLLGRSAADLLAVAIIGLIVLLSLH